MEGHGRQVERASLVAQALLTPRMAAPLRPALPTHLCVVRMMPRCCLAALTTLHKFCRDAGSSPCSRRRGRRGALGTRSLPLQRVDRGPSTAVPGHPGSQLPAMQHPPWTARPGRQPAGVGRCANEEAQAGHRRGATSAAGRSGPSCQRSRRARSAPPPPPTNGSPIKEMATDSRRFMPPLYVRTCGMRVRGLQGGRQAAGRSQPWHPSMRRGWQLSRPPLPPLTCLSPTPPLYRFTLCRAASTAAASSLPLRFFSRPKK